MNTGGSWIAAVVGGVTAPVFYLVIIWAPSPGLAFWGLLMILAGLSLFLVDRARGPNNKT